jgi:hypothetical protein
MGIVSVHLSRSQAALNTSPNVTAEGQVSRERFRRSVFEMLHRAGEAADERAIDGIAFAS